MFYYYKLQDGKVEFVHLAKNVSVEDFNIFKEDAERKDPSIKYEIVPEDMEPLAEYATEMGKQTVDRGEIAAQIEEIKEACRGNKERN